MLKTLQDWLKKLKTKKPKTLKVTTAVLTIPPWIIDEQHQKLVEFYTKWLEDPSILP